jgi:hypothetical protein
VGAAVTSQKFQGPVSAAISGEVVHVHQHYYWGEPEPPDDPEMSRQCPQCRKLTWRYTEVCIHCRLDLCAWDSRSRGWRGWLKRFWG